MTLDQILSLLTSQKVYDQTASVWRAYDGNGIEIADVGGVLQRGLHGWLLWTNAYGQFTHEYQIPELVPAGHWKHLFRPIRTADTQCPAVHGQVRVRVTLPVVFDLRQAADTEFVFVRSTVGCKVIPPTTGVACKHIAVRRQSAVAVHKPRCAANPPFLRHISRTRTNFGEISTGCSTPDIRFSSKSFYSYMTPDTVQNPTEEMLAMWM
jgi:hypothetical protein